MLGGGLGDILGRNIKPKQEKKSESLKIKNSETWDVVVQLGLGSVGHPSLSVSLSLSLFMVFSSKVS